MVRLIYTFLRGLKLDLNPGKETKRIDKLMKKPKIFIACDTSSSSEAKKDYQILLEHQ